MSTKVFFVIGGLAVVGVVAMGLLGGQGVSRADEEDKAFLQKFCGNVWRMQSTGVQDPKTGNWGSSGFDTDCGCIGQITATLSEDDYTAFKRIALAAPGSDKGYTEVVYEEVGRLGRVDEEMQRVLGRYLRDVERQCLKENGKFAEPWG